jgi:hypothetical protein
VQVRTAIPNVGLCNRFCQEVHSNVQTFQERQGVDAVILMSSHMLGPCHYWDVVPNVQERCDQVETFQGWLGFVTSGTNFV